MSRRTAAPASIAADAPEPLGEDESADYSAMLARLLPSLLRMCIAKGITYPSFDAMVQRAYVQAAQRQLQGGDASASRLHVLTGIRRKNIPQLLDEVAQGAPAAHRTLPVKVFDTLTSDPDFMDGRGRIKPLPYARRDGGEVSFEALVERVSRDVRPRAVLDQMLAAGTLLLSEDGLIRLNIAVPSGAYVRGTEVPGVERALSPAIEAAVNGALRAGYRAGSLSVTVHGLSQLSAEALLAVARERLHPVLLAFNDEAERRARDDRKAKRDGDCTLHVSASDWIEGWRRELHTDAMGRSVGLEALASGTPVRKPAKVAAAAAKKGAAAVNNRRRSPTAR